MQSISVPFGPGGWCVGVCVCNSRAQCNPFSSREIVHADMDWRALDEMIKTLLGEKPPASLHRPRLASAPARTPAALGCVDHLPVPLTSCPTNRNHPPHPPPSP